ncbi:RNA-binding protein [Bauldia sp.]|uniref:RNA-binding protein n=1 Tax=Bauldia sp. TaxID=2575872 RepID=UPI003BA9203E
MPRRGEPSERTCIVTRQTRPVDGLIRFVADPDGGVVADLRRRLPGRGVWVTADAAHVDRAARKQMFRRGLGDRATARSDLADQVGRTLRRAAIAALSMARKAGEAVTGFGKVEGALGQRQAIAVIHAAEAGEDGVSKVAAATRRAYGDAAGEVAVVQTFTEEELSLAFGRTHVIHAALLAGSAGANALRCVRSLVGYVGEDKGVGEPGRMAADPGKVSAGQ